MLCPSYHPPERRFASQTTRPMAPGIEDNMSRVDRVMLNSIPLTLMSL